MFTGHSVEEAMTCAEPVLGRLKVISENYCRLRAFKIHLHVGAVADKDELIRFRGQKVKDQGHSENKCTLPAKAF